MGSRETRQRRLTGLEGPSSSALFQHSFPQPEELFEVDEDQDGRSNGQTTTRAIKSGGSSTIPTPRASTQKDDVLSANDEEEFVDAPSEPDEDLRVESNEATEFNPPDLKKTRRSSSKSFVTASTSREHMPRDDSGEEQEQASALQLSTSQEEDRQRGLGKRPVSTAESSNDVPAGSTIGEPSVDAASTSSLLPHTNVSKTQGDIDTKTSSKGILARVTRRSQQNIGDMDHDEEGMSRTKSNLRNLVKFDIPEDSKRASLHLKAKAAQMTVQRASNRLRRHKLKDGLVVKMERMLVRVDAAGKDVPEDFDENGNQKIDSRVKDKWREYMIVCRQSISDDADFVLQMYKTRVGYF